MTTVSMLPMRVDPVTFEILRHRLWSINEEAGHSLLLLGGEAAAGAAIEARQPVESKMMTNLADGMSVLVESTRCKGTT